MDGSNRTPKNSAHAVLLICVLWILLSYPAASASSIGFYSGTFDPPTQAQLKIVACALGNAVVPPECQRLGKQISRLIIWVEADGLQETYASARERVLMLKKALNKYGERVEIVAGTAAESEERARAVQADKSGDRSIRFASYGAYSGFAAAAGDDGNQSWVIIPVEGDGNYRPVKAAQGVPANVTILSDRGAFRSLSAAELRDRVSAGRPIAGFVPPEVREVIETLGLYQEVSADLAKLQRVLFEEGWRNFLKDLGTACPIVISRQQCAALDLRWREIPDVVDTPTAGQNEQEASARLIYRKLQSEDRWAEKFSNTALKFLRGQPEFAKFKPIADDIGTRVLHGYPYGKLPHLRKVTIRRHVPAREAATARLRPLTCSASPGTYNMDIDQYVADRFPIGFAEFVKDQLRQGLISPRALYVHNRPFAEAFDFHRRDGYSDFYFLQTRRGQLHRNIYLAARRNPLAYRVVLTDVRGYDRRANVLCQLERARVFSAFQEVQSRPAPLFVFDPGGVAAKFAAGDILLFGFKGNWTRLLQANQWRRSPLVKEGLDIDVFSHPDFSKKIVVARNVYGDDANLVLDAFYKKGIRRVLYLGTAGAIADYEIGDVVIPDQFVDGRGVSIDFRGNAAQHYEPELASILKVYGHEKHGWVQSLFHETKELLLDWRGQSVGSLDIEGLHLGRFARDHKDLEMALLLVISDQTLGETTIEESNAYRDVIDASVDKLQGFFLPRWIGSKAGS